MPKNRVAYNTQAVYVGPSPSSGYHFIDDIGITNNNYTTYLPGNYNLIKKINRVTDFNYNITLPREEYKQLGKSKLAENIILNHPTVAIDFEYYLNGITNEARLGWLVNHPFNEEFRTGEILYPNNFGVFVFSGLNTYGANIQPDVSPFWPGTNRANRNIFLVVTYGQNEDEVTKRLASNDVFSRNANVISFGDCYMTSYQTSCSVGATPKAKVGFVSDNILFYTGSSGVGIPAINPKNAINYDDIKFIIPEEPVINDLSIVLPSEINLDIEQVNDNSVLPINQITGFGVKFSDIKIQSYSIDIKFEREDLRSIGYKAPASRRINFPVPISLNITSLVGDESTSKLEDIIKKDAKYNLTLRMKDRFINNYNVRYDFRKATLQDFQYTSSIESNKTLSINLKVNCSPDDLQEGFFVSGMLSNILTADLLITEDSLDILKTEHLGSTAQQGDGFFLNLVPLY